MVTARDVNDQSLDNPALPRVVYSSKRNRRLRIVRMLQERQASL
jgi:hypothetical protein